jgi:hypothetical protein
MSTLHGLPFNDDGRLRVKAAAPTGYSNGFGLVLADNAVAYTALGASAVPSTAVWQNGFVFDSDRLQTTVDTAASDVYQNGHRFRQDGALVVVAASPSGNDPFIGGWGHQATAACIEVIP